MAIRLHAVDAGDAMTVAVGGWLAGSAIFGIGFALFATGYALSEGEASVLVLLPMFLFFALFGAGLLSVVFALPTGMILAAFLKLFGVPGKAGFLICVGIGVLYAAGLSRLPTDWQWWKDFWYAAPIYGAATGIIYARTSDA